MRDRIQARYWIETAYPLAEAAAVMAGEQSTGTFVRVPGETDELRDRYAARVKESGFAQTASYSSGLATRPNAAGSLVRSHGTSGTANSLCPPTRTSRVLRDPKEVAFHMSVEKGFALSPTGQGAFGTATAYGDPRQMQFYTKINF